MFHVPPPSGLQNPLPDAEHVKLEMIHRVSVKEYEEHSREGVLP